MGKDKELMQSAKSRAHKVKKTSYRRREHKNKKFYNSKAWKDTREAYLKHYQYYLFENIQKYKWEGMELKPHQVGYILALEYLPCESCLRLYVAEAYEKVAEGKELDHIEGVNPENATDRVTSRIIISLDIKGNTEYEDHHEFGDPYSFDNLQLLCKTHHAKKSQRERQ